MTKKPSRLPLRRTSTNADGSAREPDGRGSGQEDAVKRHLLTGRGPSGPVQYLADAALCDLFLVMARPNLTHRAYQIVAESTVVRIPMGRCWTS